MSYITTDDKLHRILWMESQTKMKETHTYQTISNIPPEVKAVIAYFNAKPTSGCWCSMGWHWYTFIHNCQEYVMCIAKRKIPEHKNRDWEYADIKWTIAHDMFNKTKDEQEKLNIFYKDCTLLDEINDFINQNREKLIHMPTNILPPTTPQSHIVFKI